MEFEDKFIEDAFELIDQLELRMLDFEDNLENEDMLNEIFRIMHTIKGTAGMFGFRKIEKLTHLLEDIYSDLRNGTKQINNEIVNYTFETIDVVKFLLEGQENISDFQEMKYNNLYESIAQLITLNPTEDTQNIDNNNINLPLNVNAKIELYAIQYTPLPDAVEKGVFPESIFEELNQIGELIKFEYINSEIPENEGYNKYFDIFITGFGISEQIEDMFIFFQEDEYLIKQISSEANDRKNELINFVETRISETQITELDNQIHEIQQNLIQARKISIETEQVKEDLVYETEERKEKTYSKKEKNNELFIKLSSQKLDDLMDLLSDLVILHSKFENIAGKLNDYALKKQVVELNKISKKFKNEIIHARLVQLDYMLPKLRRIVRDTALKLEKNIQFEALGMETALDKNILSKIEKASIHLLRNCIDHGVESEKERLSLGKTPYGKVNLKASTNGPFIHLQVSDDGRGINAKDIANKAISKGLLSEKHNLYDNDIYNLIFLPGFSTADFVSEVSGRGVGLDVVKKEITDLRGEISVESVIGSGTSFHVKLPVSLSIVECLHLVAADQNFLFPLNNVLFTKEMYNNDCEKNNCVFNIRNEMISAIELCSFFKLAHSGNSKARQLIVFEMYNKKYGIVVNKVIGNKQIVIKPLGFFHENQKYFSGTGDLGNGKLAFVLAPKQLVDYTKVINIQR